MFNNSDAIELSNQQRGNKMVNFQRITNDGNGNPRYVIHFTVINSNYIEALILAKKIGGKKYHTKQYGGGIVFQSYSTTELSNDIMKIK